MAQVSFYVIENPVLSIELLACRLCRRVAIGAQTPLFVRFDDPQAMQAFDQLLWQFEPDSFVPHAIDDLDAPVCLGLEVPQGFDGCCLNLGLDAINHPALERVLEIIGMDDAAKQHGRLRFKAYRQQGLSPDTHHVKT